MNENYIDNVRKSLYSDIVKKHNISKKMPKKSVKIIFGADEYKSEVVFNLPKNLPRKSKEKLKNRGGSSSDDVFVDSSKYTELGQLKKKTRKRKIEIDYKNKDIFPSTSETSDLSEAQKEIFSYKKLWRKRTEDFKEDYVFNLNEFFSTKEPSLNESFTESHSGIEYEFPSDELSNVQITSGKICGNPNPEIQGSKNCEYNPNSDSDNDENTLEGGNHFNSNDGILIDDTCIDNGNIAQKSNKSMNEDAINENIQNFQKEPMDVVEVSSSDEVIPLSGNTKENINVIEISSSGEFITLSGDTEENNVHSDISHEIFDLEYQKLVILKQKTSLPCFGLCSLKVLHGKLEILGSVLTKRSKEVNIYSPRGSSLLVLQNITDNDEENNFAEIETILSSSERLKDITIDRNSAVFICSKIIEPKIAVLEKYLSQQIFPKIDNSRMPQIQFDPKDTFNIILINNEWNEVLKNVTSSTKLLITGGKGVGKSTFVRYAINKLLNRFEKIRIIDLDPGQSEFSVPGCISVVTLFDPILGPNYTHLQRTDRSYLSNINVGLDPKEYISTTKYLMESLHTMEDIPTIINYMGFAKGIGLNILSSVTTFIKPTHIVQIESKNNKKNFNTDITLRIVEENCNLFGGDLNDVNFDLIKISAMTDDNKGWSLESRQVREMCVLAYFGEAMKNGVESLTSHQQPMYEISLKSVSITDSQGQNLSPAAVNANMVALCSATENPKIFTVLGYGIVRSVDLQNETLVLLTPEPIDVLENVFYLILTSVSLPPSVYMTTDDITGLIPYVMEGELENLGQLIKRSYIPVNK